MTPGASGVVCPDHARGVCVTDGGATLLHWCDMWLFVLNMMDFMLKHDGFVLKILDFKAILTTAWWYFKDVSN